MIDASILVPFFPRSNFYSVWQNPLLLQHQQHFPQDLKSNIQVHADEVSEQRKRSYDEALLGNTETVKQEHPEAKDMRKPAPTMLAPPPPPEETAAQEAKQVESAASLVKQEPRVNKPKKKAPKKPKSDSDSTQTAEPKKDTKWLLMLEELKDYKADHGNCIVPRGYSPNPRLASWVAEQR